MNKVEELRKNKKVDNDFALELEDASDDDWDKPKVDSKKEAKSPSKSSDYGDDDWDMDDKDLGLEDKTEKKKEPETKTEIKQSAVPAKVETA